MIGDGVRTSSVSDALTLAGVGVSTSRDIGVSLPLPTLPWKAHSLVLVNSHTLSILIFLQWLVASVEPSNTYCRDIASSTILSRHQSSKLLKIKWKEWRRTYFLNTQSKLLLPFFGPFKTDDSSVMSPSSKQASSSFPLSHSISPTSFKRSSSQFYKRYLEKERQVELPHHPPEGIPWILVSNYRLQQ